MKEEQRLLTNIKTILYLLVICVFSLFVCIFIDKFFLKEEKIKETITESELGEIQDIEEPLNHKYPLESNVRDSSIIGNTFLNLFQSNDFSNPYDFMKGLYASNDTYMVLSKYNQSSNAYDLILINKDTQTEEIIMSEYNPHFLHIYNGFILGVYDSNYNKTLTQDCIFIYNIEKKNLTIYDKELGTSSSRIFSSFITDGKNMYVIEAYSGYLYSISFNAKQIKKITSISAESMSDYAVILNLQNNIMEIETLYRKYMFNIRTHEATELVKESYYPNIKYNNDSLRIVSKNNNFVIFKENETIYTGQLKCLNVYNEIFIANDNILYYYNGKEFVSLLELKENINQIYLDKTRIILLTEGGNYEIYSRYITNNQ